MRDVNSIVVGVDGSAVAQTAVRFGAHQACRSGVPLTLVHVLPDDVPERIESQLTDLRADNPSIHLGSTARALLREAECPVEIVSSGHVPAFTDARSVLPQRT